MAFSSGFYNAFEHDRKYDARQFGQLFDGIIRDGVFMSIGTCFMAKADGTDMSVVIGAGHGWFNRSWINNDAPIAVYLSRSEVLLNRIDTIVLDIDGRVDARTNTLKVIKGTPATNPVRPTLVKSSEHNQYPICDIRINAEVTKITQANITNRVGTSDTPFVTGILDTINIDSLIAQWQTEWNEYIVKMLEDTKKWDTEQRAIFNTYKNNLTSEINAFKTAAFSDINTKKQEFIAFENDTRTDITNRQNAIFNELSTWKDAQFASFNQWFSNVQYILSGDAAGKLQLEIEEILRDMDNLETRLQEGFLTDSTINAICV